MLGKNVKYSEVFKPGQLEFIPRKEQRDVNNVDASKFVGYDVWNCFEVSAMTTKGQPVNVLLKIVYPCDSPFMVESKSLKYTLVSTNMEQWGETRSQCVKKIIDVMKAHLEKGLKCKVEVFEYTPKGNINPFEDYYSLRQDYLDDLDFKTDVKLEKQRSVGTPLKFTTDILRSNCRQTNQPDWADVYILMKGEYAATFSSLVKYIASHRKIQHFHEEMCELMFKELYDFYKPEQLMVACLYTRRGGIDINPIRATDESLIPKSFKYNLLRTIRQ